MVNPVGKKPTATLWGRIRRRWQTEVKLAYLPEASANDSIHIAEFLTSPSSEHVRKRLGDDSVTILFTLSPCDRYILAFVLPSFKYLTPLYMF